MDTLCPTIAKFRLKGPTGKLQPRLIEIVAQLVGTGHPDQNGRSICDQAEALLTLAKAAIGKNQLGFCLLPLRPLPHERSNDQPL